MIKNIWYKNFFFIAYHYLFTRYQDASIKFMIKICFIGILIATCSLALVVAIMNGFEQATYQKMQSIYPDLIIDTNHESISLEKIQPLLNDPELKILHTASEKIGQVLLHNPDSISNPYMLMIRGIIPEQESHVSNISKKIIDPHQTTLQNLVHDQHIIIGATLAQQLELKVGDQANILYCKDQQLDLCMNFKHADVTIAGIFKTGIEELDANVVYCHQELFDIFFEQHPIDQLHLRLCNMNQEQECLKKLQRDFDCTAYSWKDLYPTLVSALKLEKWAMIFILSLIILIASMNIMSLMSMFITQKKRDIAIFLCFGMSQTSIKKIFAMISVIIATLASAFGLTLAWIIGIILQWYPFIKLPDNIYDSDYLPIELELTNFCAIFMVTVIISLITSTLATKNISRIKIIETLKNP